MTQIFLLQEGGGGGEKKDLRNYPHGTSWSLFHLQLCGERLRSNGIKWEEGGGGGKNDSQTIHKRGKNERGGDTEKQKLRMFPWERVGVLKEGQDPMIIMMLKWGGIQKKAPTRINPSSQEGGFPLDADTRGKGKHSSFLR